MSAIDYEVENTATGMSEEAKIQFLEAVGKGDMEAVKVSVEAENKDIKCADEPRPHRVPRPLAGNAKKHNCHGQCFYG